MPGEETRHLRVLIANESGSGSSMFAQVVAGIGHEVIAREIYGCLPPEKGPRDADPPCVEPGLTPEWLRWSCGR
jgi:hypothetical protein